MGFFVTGVLSLIILVDGVLSPSVPLGLFGAGGLVASAIGLWAYRGAMARRDYLRIYADGVEFVRGPQRGFVPFSEVTGIQGLEWGASLYPYSRASRVLVLQTARGEWQIGSEIANAPMVHETVVRALNDYHRRP